MKKLFIESRNGETDAFTCLFNYLYEQADYNLDSLVKGSSLTVDDSISEEFINKMGEFLSLTVRIIQEADAGKQKEIWSSFEKLDDYEGNKKFIRWLRRYAEEKIGPGRDAAFIRQMGDRDFEEMSQYCFDNLVLKNAGIDNIDEKWDRDQITVIRKMFFMLLRMVMVDFYSDDHALEVMEKTFGLDRKCFGTWLPMVRKHEDRLWKIMLMRQYSRIENYLDELTDQCDMIENAIDKLTGRCKGIENALDKLPDRFRGGMPDAEQ